MGNLTQFKWSHRKPDLELFFTLISSRSNIFLHGSSGTGKTTFIRDCFAAVPNQTPMIYIDTIEYYSEKLISIAISQQLHSILQQSAINLKLAKAIKRKFVFTVYKTLSSLLDAFLKLQETLKEIKKKNTAQCP